MGVRVLVFLPPVWDFSICLMIFSGSFNIFFRTNIYIIIYYIIYYILLFIIIIYYHYHLLLLLLLLLLLWWSWLYLLLLLLLYILIRSLQYPSWNLFPRHLRGARKPSLHSFQVIPHELAASYVASAADLLWYPKLWPFKCGAYIFLLMF